MKGRTPTLALVLTAVLTTSVAGQTPAKDPYLNGCVDCHVKSKDADTRLSTLMTSWASAVSAAMVEKAKAASADPARIKGKHPVVPNVASSMPQTCLKACHKKASTIAPPFAQLLHTLHLVGGTANKYVMVYKSDCTHCHKLDPKTGVWTLPSGAEK